MIFAIIIASSLLTACSSGSGNNVSVQSVPAQGNNVSIQANDVPGFNIQNFADLVKKTSDPAAIEKAINDGANTVNNLDLNKDGNTDFLKVTETANTIQVVDNDVNPAVTICTLNVTPGANNQAAMNIQGSPQYCGNNYNYHSSFTLTDFLLLHYMLTPHRYYYPHYAYGYHPMYYHPYRVSPYRTVTRTTYRTVSPGASYRSSGSYRSPSSSYRSNTSSTPSRSSLSSPVRSQRSFTPNRSNSGGFRSSGFGRSSSSSSFGGSSRSSFGGSRSSFGGGRRR